MIKGLASLLITLFFFSVINSGCFKNNSDCNEWEVNDDCRCTCLTSPCCIQSGIHTITLCGDENRNTTPGSTTTVSTGCSEINRTYTRKL